MQFLKVPYAEKDEAKALGARWNQVRKAWYVPDGQATAPFERWLDGAPTAAGPAGNTRVDSIVGVPVVGQHYVEIEHDCNPFTPCPVCAPVLQQSGWQAAHAASLAMLAALGGSAQR
jgi:hypothetical protein